MALNPICSQGHLFIFTFRSVLVYVAIFVTNNILHFFKKLANSRLDQVMFAFVLFMFFLYKTQFLVVKVW